MLALGAVHPDGLGVIDRDGVDRGHSHGGAGGGRLEPGVEARDVLVVQGDGLAGIVKGRLRDRVVACDKLELHHVADGGLDVVGRELERAVDAYCDCDHLG